MNDADLDRSYTALCQALAAVGEDRTNLFLAMMCLALMSRSRSAEDVLPLIAQVEMRCCMDGEPTSKGPIP